MKNKKIKIIDAIMGTGKTSWAISHITDAMKQGQKYIYITPTISEVDRVAKATKMIAIHSGNRDADAYGGQTVGSSISIAVSRGASIACTHAAICYIPFSKISDYHIILDETTDVISVLDSWDIDKILIAKGLAEIIDDNDSPLGARVAMTTEGSDLFTMPGSDMSRLAELVAMIMSGKVLCDRDSKSYYILSDFDKLMNAKSLTIMTYNIEGAQISAMLPRSAYDKMTIKNGQLIDWYEDCDKDAKADIYHRISWYSVTSKCEEMLQKTRLTFGGQQDSKVRDVMHTAICKWSTQSAGSKKIMTCYKSAHEHMAKKNRTQYPAKRYVSYNIRGTNDYADATAVGYFIDRRLNPCVISACKKIAQKYGGVWSETENILNDIIQWIWRSAIRCGGTITLWIPAEKTKSIFLNWLCPTNDEPDSNNDDNSIYTKDLANTEIEINTNTTSSNTDVNIDRNNNTTPIYGGMNTIYIPDDGADTTLPQSKDGKIKRLGRYHLIN